MSRTLSHNDYSGEVVISQDGNPNSYIAVASLANQSNKKDEADEEDKSGPANMFAG